MKESILDEFKKFIGDLWGRFTPEEIEELGKLGKSYVNLYVREQVNGEDVAEDKRLLDSAFGNWKWAGKSRVRKALLKSVRNVLWAGIEKTLPIL